MTEKQLDKLLDKYIKKMEKAEKEKDMETYNKCVMAIQIIEEAQGF